MELTELLTIYPNSTITSQPLNSQDYLSFPLNQEWINFPNAELSAHEKKLLNLLFKNKQINLLNNEFSNDPWATYLNVPGSKLPTLNQKIRIILFQVDFRKSDYQLSAWSNFFAKMLPQPCLTNLQIDERCGLVLEPFSSDSPNLKEFDGIRQTLDSDFSTNSRVFIGHFWQPSPTLRNILLLEKKFFQSEITTVRSNTFCLPQIFLQAVSQQILAPELLAAYRTELNSYPEIQAIIPTLYHQQGNLSSAAKELFLHRNTLQYRLDKFYRETQLSLKNMNDLVFCYFLLISNNC